MGGATLVMGGVVYSFGNDRAGDEVYAMLLAGLGVYAGGVVYDLVSAGRYAGRVTVAPSVDGPSGAPVGVLRVRL